MADEQITKTITVRQVNEGGDVVVKAINATAAAMNQAGQAAGSLAAVTETSTKRQLSAYSSIDAVLKRLDVNYRNLRQYEGDQRKVNRAMAAGGEAAVLASRAAEILATKQAAAAKTAQELAAAQEKMRREAQGSIAAQEKAAAAAERYQAALNSRLGVRDGPDAGRREEIAATFAAAEANDRLRAKYDEQFAAARKLAAAREEILTADQEGILSANQVAAALRRQQAEYDNTIQKLERVAQIQKESAQRQVNTKLVVPDRGADIEAYAAELDRLQAKFDPAFAAQQRYNGVVEEAGYALSRGAIGQQAYARAVEDAKQSLDATIASLDKLTAKRQEDARATIAQRDAAQVAATQFRQQLDDRLGVQPEKRENHYQRHGDIEAAFADHADQARKAHAEINPAIRATDEYNAAVERARIAVEKYGVSQAEADRYIAAAQTRKTNQILNLDREAKANEAVARGVGLTAYGYQNLGYQVNDVVTSLASGISPMQTFAQQGGQILQIFQGGQGGISGALKGLAADAKMMAGAIGIGGAAVGVLAGAMVTAVAAGLSYSKAQTDVQRSLAGAGRTAGTTVDEINRIAEANAEAAGLSTRQAREMISVFAATGDIGPEMYGKLLRAAKDYAATTGQDLPTAQKALAEAFADPAKGAETLNKQLRFLSGTTRDNIETLVARGDKLGAQKALNDAFSAALSRASDLTSNWTKLTNALGRAWDEFYERIGKGANYLATGGSLDQQLAAARKRLEAAQAQSQSWVGRLNPGLNRADIKEATEEIAEIERKQSAEAAKNAKAAADKRSDELAAIVKTYSQSAEKAKALETTAANIDRLLKAGTIDPNGEARAIMKGLEASAKQIREDMEKGGTAYADKLRAAQFDQKTVGYSPQAMSRAQIEEEANNERRRTIAETSDPGELLKRLKTLDEVLATKLATAQQQAVESTSTSGRYVKSLADVPERFRGMVYDSATKHGQDPDLMASMLWKESRFRTNLTSPAGAKGIAQFMPAAAERFGVDVWDPQSSIEGMAKYLKFLKGRYNGRVEDMLAGYNMGEGNTDDFIKRGRTRLNSETSNYIATITTRPPGSEELSKEERALNEQRRLNANEVRNSTELLGRNTSELNIRGEVDKRLSDLRQRGIEITTELTLAERARAEDMEKHRVQLQNTRLGQTLSFEREQLGRTDSEQGYYARARGEFGDTNNPYAQAAIDTMRVNDNLKQAKDLTKEAFSGLASDLRNGVDAATALSNVMNRLIDKLLNSAIDSMISGLFGGMDKAGGGGFGGLIAGAAKMFGFAEGGYTGPGGKYQPAGIVHAGEYVFDAASTARIGVAALESMRAGMRGYAEGGYVADYAGGFVPEVPAPPANDAGPTFIANIESKATGDPDADQRAAESNARAMRDQFDQMWAARAQREMSPGGMLYAAGARRGRG